MKKIVVICGPTASGKTDLAHALALSVGGEIVNADSMQVYKQLPIITASPTFEQKEEVNYHLYNFLDVSHDFSVAKYVSLASDAIQEIHFRNRLPIIVGGTGMYINALLYGYNQMPEIAANIRSDARALREKIGAEKFFQELQSLDPKICEILNVNDGQRTIRAYEIIKQTGLSILDYQSVPLVPPLKNAHFKNIFLLPERRFLYDNCNKRFAKMIAIGAIEEIQNLYQQYGVLKTSAIKALGVAEIIAYLNGLLTKDEAILQASAKTRQYAKRQITWFSHQLKDKEILQFSSLSEYEQINLNLNIVNAV